MHTLSSLFSSRRFHPARKMSSLKGILVYCHLNYAKNNQKKLPISVSQLEPEFPKISGISFVDKLNVFHSERLLLIDHIYFEVSDQTVEKNRIISIDFVDKHY